MLGIFGCMLAQNFASTRWARWTTAVDVFVAAAVDVFAAAAAAILIVLVTVVVVVVFCCSIWHRYCYRFCCYGYFLYVYFLLVLHYQEFSFC